jgi:hypothetical protein
MSNIWADTFSTIREPHFSEEKKEKEEPGEKKHKEGPAEEKAEDKKGEKETEDDKPKKWWDDDGDGKGYEKGEVEGKFKKNVKKEELELDENRAMARDPEGRKSGYSKQPDPSKAGFTGVGNMSIAQIAKMSAKIKKEKETQKEERDLSSKTDKNDKIEVRKNIRNKVNTKPTVSEELEAWIGELLDEGYDLSSFTLEEVAAIYESVEVEQLDESGLPQDTIQRAVKERQKRVDAALAKDTPEGDAEGKAGMRKLRRSKSQLDINKPREVRMRANEEYVDEADTYGMPPRGDAERQKADPMSAAKAKAARAKVTKERADYQVAQQAQRLKVSSNESVLSYVAGRTPLFEGVYDPKKSKLKPASERTKTAMTDAQRKAAKKEAERTSEIHSKGETLLVGLTSSGKKGRVQTTPTSKSAAPEANRQVKGKYDKLGKAADSVLKNLKDK